MNFVLLVVLINFVLIWLQLDGVCETLAYHVVVIQVEDKVCGSDGVTYVNECIMRMTSCRSQKPIHTVEHSHCGLSV